MWMIHDVLVVDSRIRAAADGMRLPGPGLGRSGFLVRDGETYARYRYMVRRISFRNTMVLTSGFWLLASDALCALGFQHRVRPNLMAEQHSYVR